jgi:tripartite-type tricarboxylate transporter receptor subunit TctC
MKRSTIALLAAAVGALNVPSGLASAQDWPAKPVRIISPFAAGGGSDTLGRILANQLSEKLGKQFLVENRGGAGGLIGSAAAAKAEPDGYTFVISSIATLVIAPATNANAGFDPLRSFTHIAYIGGPPTVIVVHPSLGVKTFKDLLAAVKSSGQPLAYVSPGPGTLGNLLAEFWAQKENLKLSHISYKGSGQAVSDLVAGHVKMGSMTLTAALGQIRAGTILPLAVSSANRLAEFPGVPTLKELGYPDLVATTWFAVAGPAGVPNNIVQRLNQEIIKALDTPAVRKRFEAEEIETEKMSPEELTRFVESEMAKWIPIARNAISPASNR